MKTEIVKIDSENIDLEKVKTAAGIIKKGGLVAFPTETVYGLAADFSNKQAVDRIFVAKKRPKDKPLTVQIQDIAYLEKIAYDISTFAYQLMSEFWPGPLTLVLKAKGDLPAHIKAKAKTVGVRMSAHKIAQSLIKESGTALVVPSANISGDSPARTAEEALLTFNGLIEMVIDGGRAELGITSTVVDLSVSPFEILREGAISRKDIQSVKS